MTEEEKNEIRTEIKQLEWLIDFHTKNINSLGLNSQEYQAHINDILD